jgi:uncharacterized protein with HEPN domain
MRPETAKFLHDMLDAADHVGEYVQGKTADEYLADNKLRDAVQWNFAVIGEALSQLEKTDPDTAHQITGWRRIIAFRNQLIHGYGVIRHQITWDIIQSKLPILRSDVQALLASA